MSEKKGLTFIELMIVIILLIFLTGTLFYVFRAILLSWSAQETRTGIDISLDFEIESMVRELREVERIQSTSDYDEIRFTPDHSTFYIYYLYNENDSYTPPPAFDQSTYELRKATLTGGIDGTFIYGDGQLIIADVLPPTTSDLSIDGNIITLDISITRDDETIRSRTDVRPRNL